MKLVILLEYQNIKITLENSFRMEKVTKKKGNILYVKWKGYNNLLNSWSDKTDIV